MHVGLLDQNGLSASQRADIRANSDKINYVPVDFSKPISMDILFSKFSSTLLRVNRLARVLVVPGSIHQLEEDEDRKLNESFKEPKIHTACFWFHDFKVKESKFNVTVEHVQASEENLHCLSLPTNNSGLMLNFDYNGPHGEFKRSIHFFWNPKTIFTDQLIVDLKNAQSVEEFTKFLRVELRNPKAKIVNRGELYVWSPCIPPGTSFYEKLFHRLIGYSDCKPTDRPETVVFESDFEFSNETKQFISESCNKNRGEKSDSSKEYRSRWLVSHMNLCPIEITPKIPENLPVNGELLLSNTAYKGGYPSESSKPVSVICHFVRFHE